MSDKETTVVLAYPWGEHKADAEIKVDQGKAADLIAAGLARLPEKKTPTKAKG